MGARGKQSSVIRKAPRIDARPHSSLRGISEGSPAYFDLVNGDALFWTDPADPERLAAWQLWGERILAKWQRPGWRPAAWVQFDLPLLVDRAGPWRADMLERWRRPGDKDREISLAEFVYALRETSEAEREEIEEGWRKSIDLADGRADLLHELDVPPWFIAS